MILFLLMIFKILSAQLYCKLEEQQNADDQANDSKMHFIQFQVIVDDQYQQFIKVKYENLEQSEIVLNHKRKRFLMDNMEIPFHGLGIWQYIFINSTNNNTNIKWYSNFELIIEQQIKNKNKVKYVELLKEEYIQAEFIYIDNIQETIKKCHSQQSITIRFDPQLTKVVFGDFNNNLFLLNFWVKFTEINDFKYLEINVKNKKENIKIFGILNYKKKTEISMSNDIFVKQYFEMIDWTYFFFEFNRHNKFITDYIINNKILNQNNNYNKFNLYQSYNYKQLSHDYYHFDYVYCIPGCLVCQDIVCFQCDHNLILKDGECICNKDIYFSLNECYFPDLDYFTSPNPINLPDFDYYDTIYPIEYLNLVKQNCPQYDEQKCENCLKFYSAWIGPVFCQYSYTTQWFSKNYEFVNYKVILIVFYKLEDDSYLIDQQMTMDNKEQIYKTDSYNQLLFHQSIHFIYQLGIYSNTKQVQCQENYYGNFCQRKIRNCLIQFTKKLCLQCKPNYYNIQSLCKRCPLGCDKCIIDINYNIKCVKCDNNYFLTLDYKCQKCNLENCLICYEFDNDQMSLQEALFKQNNQTKQIGCAQCQTPYYLNLLTRKCQSDQIHNQLEQEPCLISDCKHCQKNICLLCVQGFQNIDNSMCTSDKQQLTSYYSKYKYNPLFDNSWKQITLSTFLFYNYDYTHITERQSKFMIIGCDHPQFKININEFYCLSQIGQYIGLNLQPDYIGLNLQSDQTNYFTAIQHNKSVYDKSIYLSNYNNLVDPNDINSYLLDDISPTQQIIDWTIDYDFNLAFYDQQQIFGSLKYQQIKINYTFNNDQCLFLDSNLIIIYNSYIIVENLCINFKLSFDNKYYFKIENTIFEAANQQSRLQISQFFMDIRFQKFELKNVTFKNFQSDGLIELNIKAKETRLNYIYFHNVQSAVILYFKTEDMKLLVLEIYNQELVESQFQFTLISYDYVEIFELEDIKLINCLFVSWNAIFSFRTTEINLQLYNILIQTSEFYNSTVFDIVVSELLINDLQVMNCIFEDQTKVIIVDSISDISILSLTFTDLQMTDSSNLININANKGCSIFNLKITQSNFQMYQKSIIYVQADNFLLNEVIFDESILNTHLFRIIFRQLASLSNIQINSILNEQIGDPLFYIYNGDIIKIQYFSIQNSFIQNWLFQIYCKFDIEIDTFKMQNITIKQNFLEGFIFLSGNDIIVAHLTINDVVYDLAQDQTSYVPLDGLLLIQASGMSFFNFFIIRNIQLPVHSLIVFEGENYSVLRIQNLQFFQINQIQRIFDISNCFFLHIDKSKFEELNVENTFIFVEKTDEVRLTDLQLENNYINNTFSFINCTKLYLIRIYLCQLTKIQNLFVFEFGSQIQLIQITAKEINVVNSMIYQKTPVKAFTIWYCNFHLIGQEKFDSLIFQNNEQFLFLNVIMRGIKGNQLALKGNKIYLVRFTILDSQIDRIKMDINSLNSNNYIDERLLIIYCFTIHNNIGMSLHSNPFITVQSNHGYVVLNNIQIINSQFSQNKLLLYDIYNSKQIRETILINNQCQNKCLDFYGKNYNFNVFQNELTNNQGINNKSLKNIMMIKINNNLFNNQSFLYLPSGQSLKHYQVLNLITGQSTPYIHQIEIIQLSNYLEHRLIGNFNIIAYRFQNKDKVISNLTENILNFNSFSQTNSYNQLSELNLINNPYQEEFSILLEISDQQDQFQKLSLHVKTFICQIGEIFSQDMCLKCDTNYKLYSLKQNSNLCSIFDSQIATDFKHNSIKLREGYWRPFIYSHKIEKCNIKYERCIGGWSTGNKLCKIGYYGGLCDACDTNNIIGNGYYQMIDNQCKICDNQFKNGYYLVMNILFIIIIYQIKLYLKSISNQSLYQKYLLQKLIIHQHFQVINIYFIDLSSIILDILIQNISITQQILRNQEFNLPEFLGIFTNPIQFINNSTFCFSQYFGIEQYQVILMFTFLFPFIIYNIFISFSYLLNGLMVKKQHIFIQPIITLFILLGPTLIAQFTANLFYVEYSKQRYVLPDLGVRYFTQSHQQFIIQLVSPIIIFFGLIIPLILVNQVNQLTKRLFKKKIFQTFGSFILQYNVRFEIIVNYYLISLLLTMFQIKKIKFLTPQDLIPVIVLMFALKQTYKIKIFNKLLLKSWICIGLVTYITKIEQQVIDSFIIQICTSLFIILYIFFQYIRQLLFHYDKQVIGFIQDRKKLSRFFIFKIQYNEKQYWNLINQFVKLHKSQFVSSKALYEKLMEQTVLKQYGQNYQNLPTLKTEANEGIEMQQL